MTEQDLINLLIPSLLSFASMMYAQKAAKNSQDMDKIREDVAWLKGKMSEHLRQHP